MVANISNGTCLLTPQGGGGPTADHPPDDEPQEYGGRPQADSPLVSSPIPGPIACSTSDPATLPAHGAHRTPGPPHPAPPTYPDPTPVCAAPLLPATHSRLPAANNGAPPASPATPQLSPPVPPPATTNAYRSPTSQTATMPLHSKKTVRASLKVASLNIRGGGTPDTRPKWQHVNQLLRD